MRYCFPCDVKFRTDVRFVRHMVEVHGAPWAKVERALLENPRGDVVCIRMASGEYFLMHQPPLP